MDIKVFVASFWAIFFAELADKTQIVGIGMTAKTGKPWTVMIGSISAYVLVTAISVILGSVLGRYMRPEIIKYAGGCIFIVIGILMILEKF